MRLNYGILFSFIVVLLGPAFIGGAAAQQDDTIKRIRSSGELRVGMAESAPFQFKNPVTNAWEGFNADMASDLARSLGVKLKYVDASWTTLINGLLAKQYDISMTSTFATAERAQTVLFTETYITAGEVVLVHKDSALKKISELNTSDATLSVLSGTTNEQTAKRFLPKAHIQSITTDNPTLTYLEVGNKQVQATVTDENLAKQFMRKNPGVPVRMLDPEHALNSQGRAYALLPGEYHFLNFMNTWIQAQTLSGRVAELKAKWDLN